MSLENEVCCQRDLGDCYAFTATNFWKLPKTQTTRRSILTLDKSNEPIQIQIDEACDILGIRLNVQNQVVSFDQQDQQEITLCGPREEWALRWLLKKLQSDDIHFDRCGTSFPSSDAILIGLSPCLIPKTWLFLQSLVARVPLTNTTRLLSTYKFTAIVRNTFQWLQQKSNLGENFLPQESEDAFASTESSSATLEVSPVEALQRPRKRKRDGTSIVPIKPGVIAGLNAEALYKSICSTIREVEALTNDSPDGSRGFAVEYMKATLRSFPEDAAVMLGSFLTVTNIIVQRSNENSADIFDECISPMLAMWNLRSNTKSDMSAHSTFVCHPLNQPCAATNES